MHVNHSLSRRNSYDVSVFSVSGGITTQDNPNPPSNHEAASEEPFFKSRYVVALIGLTALTFFSIHRINMSVSIIAMVNYTAISIRKRSLSESCPPPSVQENKTDEFQRKDGEFEWSPSTQGYILGSNFIGYVASLLVSGTMAERFGCKWMIFWSVFLSSLCTFLTPFAAWWNTYGLLAVQVLRGLAQGALQPAVYVMGSNWFPRPERGSLGTFMQVGMSLGIVVGGIGSGYLCDSDLFGGWPSVFYLFGGAGILLSLLTALVLHENPRVHPSISKAELDFILMNQENKLSQRRPDVPWRSLFTSTPFYALCVAFFGVYWSATHFFVVHPTFLASVLHFPIDQVGILATGPFFLMFIFGLVGSWISSVLNRRKWMAVNKVRKMWFSAACVGFSAGLVGIHMAGCDETSSVAFCVFCIAVQGFFVPGCHIVPADMSPNFAGTIGGLVTAVGGTSVFIFPMFVGWLTDNDNSLQQWNKILFISIGISMSSCIIFAIFGSADVQPWNFATDKNTENEIKKRDSDAGRVYHSKKNISSRF